jgi:hypothetical protein
MAPTSFPLPQSRTSMRFICLFFLDNSYFLTLPADTTGGGGRADQQPAPGSLASPESVPKKLRNFSETWSN